MAATSQAEVPSLLLQYPDADAIAAAYRELPKRGRLLLSTRIEDLAATLQALEGAGFCAMQVNKAGLSQRSCDVRAYKGKQGPCFETGRSARYLGSAAAVLDDDNHLLFGELRVCEKTARVYDLPPYEAFVEVGEADAQLLQRLDTDPEPFDCDTLERDAATLSEELKEFQPVADGRVEPVFYPGPFRLLVARDGSMLRRGAVHGVPRELARELIAKDGCLPPPPGAEVLPTERFQERHAAEGAACLLGELPLADAFSAPRPLRLEALRETTPAMRDRLRHTIEREDGQFILVGSDPRDQFGCCPNDDVGAANALVEAGVLQLWRAPTPPDACPTGIYAFAGELRQVDGRPQGTPDPELRARVVDALAEAGSGEQGTVVRVLRWALLAFVLFALVAMLVRKLAEPPPPPDATAQLVPMLAQEPDTRWALVLFTYSNCPRCQRLDAYTQLTLRRHFEGLYGSDELIYRRFDTEAPGQGWMKEGFDLFASTLMLFELAPDGSVVRQRALHEAGDLFEDQAGFVARLQRDLDTFMRGPGPQDG